MQSTPPTLDSSSETLEIENREEPRKEDETPLPLRALLIPRVLIAAGNYATLSLLDIAFRAVQPVFFATPIELGGLGLDPPQIGNILSVYGVVNGLFQIFFFADMHDRFGSKAIYSVAIASGIPATLTFPLLNVLARTQGLSWTVWSLVGVQLALSMAVNLAFCELSFVSHEPALLNRRVYSLHIHLHRSSLPKPGFSRSHQRHRSAPRFDHARHRTRLGYVHVFDFYQNPRTRVVCVLLHVIPRLCRHERLVVASADTLDSFDRFGLKL